MSKQIEPEKARNAASHPPGTAKVSADQTMADREFNVTYGLDPNKRVKELSREELEKQLEHLKALVYDKDHVPTEYPKMVKGKIFQTKEAQQDAGPEYVD